LIPRAPDKPDFKPWWSLLFTWGIPVSNQPVFRNYGLYCVCCKFWLDGQDWSAHRGPEQDDAILDIGASKNVLRRIQYHRRELGSFFGFASMLPVWSDEVYRLLDYERAAIDEIRPKFNKRSNRSK
jgi:hypothetical protein